MSTNSMPFFMVLSLLSPIMVEALSQSPHLKPLQMENSLIKAYQDNFTTSKWLQLLISTQQTAQLGSHILQTNMSVPIPQDLVTTMVSSRAVNTTCPPKIILVSFSIPFLTNAKDATILGKSIHQENVSKICNAKQENTFT